MDKIDKVLEQFSFTRLIVVLTYIYEVVGLKKTITLYFIASIKAVFIMSLVCAFIWLCVKIKEQLEG